MIEVCKTKLEGVLLIKPEFFEDHRGQYLELYNEKLYKAKGVDVDFGVLKLTPWRIDLVSFPSPSFDEGTRVWRNDG